MSEAVEAYNQVRAGTLARFPFGLWNPPEGFTRMIVTVRALQKAGFRVVRKHIVMSDGTRILAMPRANPVNPFTMGGIVRNAGLTIEEFRKLLQQGLRSDTASNDSTLLATPESLLTSHQEHPSCTQPVSVAT